MRLERPREVFSYTPLPDFREPVRKSASSTFFYIGTCALLAGIWAANGLMRVGQPNAQAPALPPAEPIMTPPEASPVLEPEPERLRWERRELSISPTAPTDQPRPEPEAPPSPDSDPPAARPTELSAPAERTMDIAPSAPKESARDWQDKLRAFKPIAKPAFFSAKAETRAFVAAPALVVGAASPGPAAQASSPAAPPASQETDAEKIARILAARPRPRFKNGPPQWVAPTEPPK